MNSSGCVLGAGGAAGAGGSFQIEVLASRRKEGDGGGGKGGGRCVYPQVSLCKSAYFMPRKRPIHSYNILDFSAVVVTLSLTGMMGTVAERGAF